MKKTKSSKEVKTLTSLEELRAEWGLKPLVFQTSNVEKLNQQRERWRNNHKCEACGEPMSFINGTNIFTCTNFQCKGIKKERISEKNDEDIEEKEIYYDKSFHLLDKKGAMIADNVFKEK